MISSNSRYVDSKLVTVEKTNGSNVVMITPSDPVSYTFSYSFYTVNGSDRIDTISYAFYKDPTKWWKIADANPEIMNWLILSPGTVLRIPNA